MATSEDMNYWNDPRVRGAQEGQARRFDERSMTLTFTTVNDAGSEEEITLPAQFEVCDTCDGKGTHVNPSIDSSGLSAEDFDEDPEFRDNYLSGAYDEQCGACGGMRVVPVVAESRLSDGQRDSWERVQDQEEEHVGMCAIERAERAMGA
jgi:hypothetical protein